jgi:hypothetical protein
MIFRNTGVWTYYWSRLLILLFSRYCCCCYHCCCYYYYYCYCYYIRSRHRCKASQPCYRSSRQEMRACCTALVANGGVLEGDQSVSVPPEVSCSVSLPPSAVIALNTANSHARSLSYVTKGFSQRLH